ncbi:aspartate/glutamate racemase family protein [Uliginosibacterium sp. H3]|uniref:Aspartate/glutamate racemase family protein n=1 Tax=Uliginosibacterium silvisoli TaxID=3114758 RepID=A0ABU6K238_9RHOO|nr:aspartate/glutamate racemase family protein [Uliginosibacterium sp. H3]
MRLLLLNANTSDFVTQRVASTARAVAAPGTEILPVTGNFGARVIATRTELAIANHACVDLLAEHAEGCDAVVIAVSYDVALLAAREMLEIPVVGITEAALLSASMLGTRIGIVMFGPRVLPLYQELAASYGLGARIAGWRAVDNDAPYAAGDQSEVDRLTVAAANDLVARDGCEVVVLAGAVMAGVPARLQAQVPVPLVEGVSCGVLQAELLHRLKPMKAKTGSLAALPARESVGLSDALVKRLSPSD